ncbi:N-6 DNA methylase domain protein, partial [Candidatus Magnetobacterium bavaricum]
LTDEDIKKVFEVYSQWKEGEGISKVIKNEDAAKNDYNLSPSRYVSQNGGEEVLPVEEAIVLLREAEEERVEADKKLKSVLGMMGFEL